VHDSNAKELSELQPIWSRVRALSSAIVAAGNGTIQGVAITGNADKSLARPETEVRFLREAEISTFHIDVAPTEITSPKCLSAPIEVSDECREAIFGSGDISALEVVII
jgi:hypothetical protein